MELQLLVVFTFVICSCNGQDSNYAQAVVIHCNDAICKVGFGGDNAPRETFPCVVGRPIKYVAAIEKKIYVGNEIKGNESILKLSYPINGNIVRNWNDFEEILHYIFYDVLRVAPEEHPILLSESPTNPPDNRRKTTQILFETFNVPAMYLANTNKLRSTDTSTNDEWVGGSILVSLESFQKRWISREDYAEHGPAVIDV